MPTPVDSAVARKPGRPLHVVGARLRLAPLVRLVSLALVLALALAACGTSNRSSVSTADQLSFGVAMAQRGLWSEAFFRFQQAQRMDSADAKVLNNLAVSSEALGKFDQALDYYKQALALAPGEAELKANYDRFVSFYESFRARGEEAKDGKAAAAVAPAPTPAAGEPPRPTTPEPPAPPAQPPGLEPPSGPPLVAPVPVPTPPMTGDLSPSQTPSTAGGPSHA
jgi:hypothetical protein